MSGQQFQFYSTAEGLKDPTSRSPQNLLNHKLYSAVLSFTKPRCTIVVYISRDWPKMTHFLTGSMPWCHRSVRQTLEDVSTMMRPRHPERDRPPRRSITRPRLLSGSAVWSRALPSSESHSRPLLQICTQPDAGRGGFRIGAGQEVDVWEREDRVKPRWRCGLRGISGRRWSWGWTQGFRPP